MRNNVGGSNTRYGSVGGAPLSRRRFLRMANDMIPAAKNCNSEDSAEPICTRHTRCVAEEKNGTGETCVKLSASQISLQLRV